MSRPDSDPDHRRGPIRWTWRPHLRGEPAERLARDWLAPWIGMAGDERPLPRNAHGRPVIASRDGRHDASWSHSGDILLIAVGEDVDVGVDVELLKPRKRALELARRYFTADETAWLAAQAATARDEAFVRLWCAKEAVLKAHGRGLAFGLHRLAFVEREGALTLAATAPQLGAPETWTVHEFAPLPGYRAALAWRARRLGDTGDA
ncbi:MAG: 4'-phosphopantetheinyl transferase superfamily protein [Luteimonas sp.]|nr:4'-phosphopantetheinyl transferase superfamily protein [Luteimonas sp.]